ncbi:hypothetical protein NP493_87g02051 [Ridgeia piscesae]|uniref:Uncharacterized protein n=1 Tax=Ridgeia piscesae TaxID=27915 RepID=A0AAD9UI38_RIDPI|nr:hypothetical protein NP493_87g02051 [Ridgeia piscesae]
MKLFLSTIFLTTFCIILLVVIALIGFQRFIQYYKNIPICAGKPPVQKLVIAYKCGRSSHKELDAIFKEAKTLFPSLRQLIIFYDIPRKETSCVSLKWAVGIIVSEAEDEPDLKVTMQLQDKGYKFYKLPKVSNSVKMTVHKLPDWLASRPPSIAHVYPRLASYVKIHKLCAHPWIAVHSGCTIHYMAPLARQNEFYVPEFSKDVATKEAQNKPDDQPNAAGEGGTRRQRPGYHYKLTLHTPQTPVLRSRPLLTHSAEQLASRPYQSTRSLCTVRYGQRKKKTPEKDDDLSTKSCPSDNSLAMSSKTVTTGQDMDDQRSVPSDDQTVESDSDSWVNVETNDTFVSDNDKVEGPVCQAMDSSNGIIYQFSSDSGSDEERSGPCLRSIGLNVIES